MKNKSIFALLVVMVFAVGLPAVSTAGDGEASSWTGEVVDSACYIAKGARGDGHAGCAKRCVKNGQPMGLVTDDGAYYLLAADHKKGDAYEGLKDLAGEKAVVSGSLSEKSGIKMVTVTGFKPTK